MPRAPSRAHPARGAAHGAAGVHRRPPHRGGRARGRLSRRALRRRRQGRPRALAARAACRHAAAAALSRRRGPRRRRSISPECGLRGGHRGGLSRGQGRALSGRTSRQRWRRAGSTASCISPAARPRPISIAPARRHARARAGALPFLPLPRRWPSRSSAAGAAEVRVARGPEEAPARADRPREPVKRRVSGMAACRGGLRGQRQLGFR